MIGATSKSESIAFARMIECNINVVLQKPVSPEGDFQDGASLKSSWSTMRNKLQSG